MKKMTQEYIEVLKKIQRVGCGFTNCTACPIDETNGGDDRCMASSSRIAAGEILAELEAAAQAPAKKKAPKEWTELIWHRGDDICTEDFINGVSVEEQVKTYDELVAKRADLTKSIAASRTLIKWQKREVSNLNK
jgi:hypothetical protein